ncbi:unnamed protein product [Peronospora farinosa]|uniref:Uncharacterized protein n=1 Tax=Peronospora farinosa TaxID=134698 RepID=A0AAV0SRG3_9STRA|nr:unnamed protein product [Peronospora farinosa]
MRKASGWFKAKRVRPLHARATVTFKQLQGHFVTVSIQQEHLKSLVLLYIECVGAKCPFLADSGEAVTLDFNECMYRPPKTLLLVSSK